MFDTLPEQPADALLALIGLYRADPRPQKLDLGVGVYRDDSGVTPIMAAVKAAEKVLLETRTTKAYLGPEGDPVYTDLLKQIVFGKDPGGRVAGIQTPGGTGAVRLAADLVALARPDAKILYGAPTWPNHLQILTATRLKAVPHPYFDVKTQRVNVASLVAAIEGASAGDVVLLHGCCHNPTGGELEPSDWQTVLKALQETGVVPLIDFAYHGLGKGLEGDAYGARLLTDNLDEVMVAYSCDKNFGLYRERVGALYVKARNEKAASVVMSNLAAFSRVSWSMPPDHGAAIVRTILEDAQLTRVWREEIDRMGARVRGVRAALAAAGPGLKAHETQTGMFSTLALTPEQVLALRKDHAVYMAGSGRINVAGLHTRDIPAFVTALKTVGYPVD
jgi:aromatic-amino-acid transaminase